MLNTGGGLFNQQQTPGGGLFNTATNQLGTGGGNQLGGGGLFNTSGTRTGGLGGLFNSQTPQNQQQPGRMFNMGAQTTGGIGTGLGQGGGLFQSPLGGGTGLGTGGGLTLGANQGMGGLFSTPLGGGTGNTGLFNQQQQQQQQQQQGLGSGLFSQQTAGGLFSGAGTGLGLGNTTINGTTIKFDPPTGTDTVVRNGANQNTATRLQCICAMKQYENYSTEELRWMDYQAGRNKGSTGGGLGLGVGGTKMGGGLFTQNQQSTSTAGTSLFNQNKQLGGGLNTGLGGGLFNQQQQGLGSGLFNQQQQQAGNPGGGLFNQSGTTGGGIGGGLGGGLFNQQQQQQGITGGLGLFNNNATVANTGGLGATGIGGLFNNQNTVGTGLGQQATGGGLFNTSKPNALGGGLNLGLGGGLGSNLGGGLNLGNKTGGLQLGTGLGLGKTDGLKGIGQQQPTSLGLGLGIGQSNQPKLGLGLGGGLGTGTGFGGGLGSSLGGGVKLGTGVLGLGGGSGFGGGSGLGGTLGTANQSSNFSDVAALQQQAQLQQQLQVLATSPFGDSPLFRTSLKEAAATPDPPAKADPPGAGLKHDFGASSHYKLNIRRGGAKMAFKPQSLSSPSRHVDKSLMFEGLDDLESGNATTFKPRKNFKKLVIPPHSPHPTPGVPDTTTTITTATVECPSAVEVTPTATSNTKAVEKTTPNPATVMTTTLPSTITTPPSAGNKSLTTPPSSLSSADSPALVVGSLYSNSVMKPIARRPTPPQLDNTMLAFSNPHPPASSTEHEQPSSSSPVPVAGPSGVIDTRSDYYTVPPVDELDSMATPGSSDPILVENFTVGRHNYGVIFFSGKTNVRDLNLDELVYIGHKEVAVYQDDSCKPPQGEGLNKRATITLENTWPLDKTTRQQIKDPARLLEMKYAEKVENSTTKIGARFIDYRPETGSWIFEVDHFSKYKLQENTSDDEGDQQQQKQQVQQLPLETAKTSIAKHPPLKPASSTIMETNKEGESEEEEMSDNDSEQHLRESPTHEMDAAPIPHSYNLAASMGVSSHKVQVMKASFFADPSTNNQYTTALSSQRHQRGFLLNGSTPPLFKQPGVSKPAQQQLQLQQEESPFSLLSPSMPDLSSPPVTSTVMPQGLIPFALQSEAVNDSYRTCVVNEDLRQDLGQAFERSFRTGWAPHWHFAHFGITLSSKPHHKKPSSSGLFRPLGLQKHLYSAIGPKDVVPFKISLEKLQSSPYLMPEELKEKRLSAMFEPLLTVQLQHSEVGGAGIPHIVPAQGNTALGSYTAITDSLRMSNASDKFAGHYMRCVWSLMTALWGDLTNENNIPGLDDSSSYGHQQARKDRVTNWLMAVCRQKIEKELNSSSKGNESVYLTSLFGLVSSGHIREACQLSRKHRDLRLNLLLAQCMRGSTVFRELLKKQLAVWDKTGATDFITPERLRVYALLAGLVVWETGKLILSSCQSVEWQRNLAVHLWYCCNPTATIADALNRYNDTLNDPRVSAYITQPVPVYQKDEQSTDTELYDICYHLLQLYCDHSYNLNHLVNPATFTPYILDYRLIWHVFQCLTALGYTHVSHNVLAHLHTSYASQLENAGLWQWAVFVVLHLNHDGRRAKMVQDILSRHCTGDITLNDQERFVVDQLHVSCEILYEAKAVRAMYDGKVEQQVWNLIKARQWNASHEVIMEKLAAKAIVNGHTKKLHKMLSCLADNNYNHIMNWDHQGSIVFDFLNTSAGVTALKEPVGRYELENLAAGIAMLCERIPHMPSTAPLEMLCQAEISKKMLNYNKVVTALLENETGEVTTGQPGLQYLSTMPLAEDELIAEYRSQANSFVKQLTT